MWFWAAELDRERGWLAPEELHHLRVLRRRPGARIRLLDGRGHRAEGIWRGEAEVEVLRFESLPVRGPELFLALGARETNEEALRRAAELGARRIQPVIVTRSRDAGLRPERVRLERWRTILRSGCSQSGNPWLPELAPPRPWGEIREAAAETLLALVPGAGRPLVACSPPPERLAVGPEGGWTSEELEGLPQAGLGPWVLRTHVAVAAALATWWQLQEEQPCAA